MSEVVRADAWLYGVLHGDATLLALVSDVYADVAPEGAAFPLVVSSLVDAGDVLTINGIRILTEAVYQVKVVGQGPSYVSLEAAANRIDALLHKASGSVSGGVIYSCVRIEPVRYAETSGGQAFRHLGGLYEIQVQ